MSLKRILILVSAMVLVGLIVACFQRHKVEAFKRKDISGGQLRSPLQSIFAHLSEHNYLTVSGKTYEDVRGGNPSYLEVPELHSILFVTGEPSRQATFHIFNVETKSEKTIDGGLLNFGEGIGAPGKPGQAYTEFILKANSNEFVLASQYPDFRKVITLNLTSKQVERVEDQEVPAQ